MYQWRNFQFFEEKAVGGNVAEELKEKLECSTSGRGQIAVGTEDASVHVLDRGLKLSYSFQAHSINVQYIQQLKVLPWSQQGSRFSSACRILGCESCVKLWKLCGLLNNYVTTIHQYAGTSLGRRLSLKFCFNLFLLLCNFWMQSSFSEICCVLEQQRNMLVSVGEDDTSTPRVTAMHLKMWDLDKMQPEGSSTTGPACVRSLKIFAPKFPEAKVSFWRQNCCFPLSQYEWNLPLI